MLRIRQLGDPAIRQQAVPVDKSLIKNGSYQTVVERMQQVLDGIQEISNINGNAISAPQVGEPIRLVVLRLDGRFVQLFNPTLSPQSDETFEFEEECFSFYQLRGTVTRFKYVRVSFLDQLGQSQILDLAGEQAGIVQHEVDHLDGILFIDRVETPENIRSIDFEFGEQPEYLRLVKKLHAYMSAPLA